MNRTKIYRYHIIDGFGNRIESDIPERSQAESVLNFLITRDQLVNATIIEEHVPQTNGSILGRDPDLH